MKRFFLIFIIVIIPCFIHQTASSQDYLVGSQDVLKIMVYEHPDITTVARVSEKGKITFPLIGEIEVGNFNVREIEKNIADKLSAGYISNPQVTVFIEQYRARRITVIGEVTKPGQYEITGPTTVSDVISMSLGMTKDAGYTIIVLRIDKVGEEIDHKRISIDVDKLFKDGDSAQNIQLQEKDIVYIPRIDFFYIYGEVNRPGIYRLEKGLTIKRAISIAGGFTQKASKRRIQITRRAGEKEIIKKADIDETVKTDDVIMIKECIF